jgi:hypothetical protein
VVNKNSERNTKEHRTRKTADGTAGSVRHRTVGQEQKARKTKEEGETGPQIPASNEARRGHLYMRVRDS